MKFRMILTTLLLPCVTAAQQPAATIKTEPPMDASQKSFQLYTPYMADSAQEPLNVRVHLNLRNASLQEAIKQLGDQTKQVFILEKDVPSDARVTVVAKNIRLATALDMLTDAAGSNWNWNRETAWKWTSKPVKKQNGDGAEFAFHIGKKVSHNFLQWGDTPLYRVIQNDNRNSRWNLQGHDSKLDYKAAPDIKWETQNLSSLPLLTNPRQFDASVTVKGVNPYSVQGEPKLLQTRPLDLSTSFSSLYSADTLFRTKAVSEIRSTFTCPHCKQQVTVVHQRQAPECDTCGRAFHDDWQFCPFDGAKRPASAGIDWQFCPLCGKSVKEEVKTDGSKPETKPGR